MLEHLIVEIKNNINRTERKRKNKITNNEP